MRSIIVLADDSFVTRTLAKRTLSRSFAGIEVAEAEDGEAALRLVYELSPALVLLDIQMPLLGGLQVLERIKADQPGTKVILFTVHDDEEYRLAARAAGADAFVSKKHMISQLRRVIENVVPSL
jgi:DNA-binding NarL/FixJ family response regulator